MKTYRKFLIALFLLVGALLPAANSYGQHITVEIGDQPYYTRGPWYWEHGHKWCWVHGHWNWNHTHWIKGHYRRC
ncbi:MAG: hypothetical protein ACXWBM_04980 [Chthoniobacterales bacterium]